MPVSITTPLSRDQARTLRSGDSCLLSGVIYTARDAAHKRLCELAEQGKPLPIDMTDAVIYYVGPTPARPGAGPFRPRRPPRRSWPMRTWARRPSAAWRWKISRWSWSSTARATTSMKPGGQPIWRA